jgi:hypothetical protein
MEIDCHGERQRPVALEGEAAVLGNFRYVKSIPAVQVQKQLSHRPRLPDFPLKRAVVKKKVDELFLQEKGAQGIELMNPDTV